MAFFPTIQQSPFIWGKNGQKLTPDQVEYQRELAEAARGRMGDTSPVGHWTQGAARVVDALGGVLREKRADRAEAEGLASADAYISENSVLASLLGGGPSGRMSSRGKYIPPKAPNPNDELYPVGKPGPAPEGNVDPASGLDMGTPVEFDLREGIIQTAEAIGADPLDLATAISYETGGTFDPMKAGPTTQWGQHRGLIQFGEPQAGQYGVDFSSPEAALASQLGADGAVAKYFRARGFQPGMSGLDLYSTINAGAPGRYGASDANNGGAPGDVADKWNNQMEGHRIKAAALLGGEYVPASGGREVLAAQNAPGGQNVISVLAEAMSNPWVAKKYGPVITALMDRQLKRDDMAYQAQLQQQDPMYQAQLAQLTAPKPVDPWAGTKVIDGQVVRMGEDGPVVVGDFREQDAAPVPMTPEQRQYWGIPADDTRPYMMTPDGPKLIGGSGVNITNTMGGGKFDEEFAKGDAQTLSTVSESGIAAQRNIGRINQLEGLLSNSPSGFGAWAKQAAGEWGIDTEGLSEIQAAQAMINSLVPEQRPPGSGPMSDADLELFKQSLPRIINTPEGNALIIQTMRAIAQYDAQGAMIVQRLRSGEINRAEAFEQLQARENPLAGFTAPPGAGGGADDGWTDVDGIKIRVKQ